MHFNRRQSLYAIFYIREHAERFFESERLQNSRAEVRMILRHDERNGIQWMRRHTSSMTASPWEGIAAFAEKAPVRIPTPSFVVPALALAGSVCFVQRLFFGALG